MTIGKPNQEAAETIAKNINKYMKHYQISRGELAKRLGVTQSTVGYWCTGQKIPRMDKIDGMCQIFNVQRKHIVSEPRVAIGRVVSVKVPSRNIAPRLSLTEEKNNALRKAAGNVKKAKAVLSASILSEEEKHLLDLYRSGKYKDIVSLMMDKM